MATLKEYLETQTPEQRQAILVDTSNGCVLRNATNELSHLIGYVYLEFDKYGLNKKKYQELVEEFVVGKGVAIPNTNWKFRYTFGMQMVIEEKTGSEPNLPENWEEFVWVGDRTKKDYLTFVGKNATNHKSEPFEIDKSRYNEVKNGFLLKENNENI